MQPNAPRRRRRSGQTHAHDPRGSPRSPAHRGRSARLDAPRRPRRPGPDGRGLDDGAGGAPRRQGPPVGAEHPRRWSRGRRERGGGRRTGHAEGIRTACPPTGRPSTGCSVCSASRTPTRRSAASSDRSRPGSGSVARPWRSRSTAPTPPTRSRQQAARRRPRSPPISPRTASTSGAASGSPNGGRCGTSRSPTTWSAARSTSTAPTTPRRPTAPSGTSRSRPTTVEVVAAHQKGDVALRGPAADLLLTLWRRRPLDTIDLVGDTAVAERLYDIARF